MTMSSTNPGDRTAAEIEAEVDYERKRVEGTINELQSRLSSQKLFEQATGALYEHGGDLTRTLGRQVRDNPLAAIIAGVGLAWLMAGTGPRHGQRDEGWRGDGAWRDDDVYRTGQPAGLAPVPRWKESVGEEQGGPGLAERAGEWKGALAETASDAVHSAQGAVGSAREYFAEGGLSVQGAVGSAREYLAEGGRSVQGAMGSAGEYLAESGRSVRHAGQSARDWGGQKANSMRDMLADEMESNPLVFGGIAFALGAAIGTALPRTRTEDEIIGSSADRMKENVSAVASREAQKAKAVASAVVDEGKQIVEETAGSIAERMPDADELAERTRQAALDAADRLRTAGEVEAERKGLGDLGTSS